MYRHESLRAWVTVYVCGQERRPPSSLLLNPKLPHPPSLSLSAPLLVGVHMCLLSGPACVQRCAYIRTLMYNMGTQALGSGHTWECSREEGDLSRVMALVEGGGVLRT